MFEFELDVLEEISGKERVMTVNIYEVGDEDTIMYWRENDFDLPEEDDYWFVVKSIKAKYIDYIDNGDAKIELTINREYSNLDIYDAKEVLENFERINFEQYTCQLLRQYSKTNKHN